MPDFSAMPLSYARLLPPTPRTSRLAMASPIVAVLGSPCLLVPILNYINWYVPQDFNQVGRHGHWQFWTHRGALIAATALAVTALARVYVSAGTRRGLALA